MVTNNDGYYTHYVVDGTSMKDGSKVPPEVGEALDRGRSSGGARALAPQTVAFHIENNYVGKLSA